MELILVRHVETQNNKSGVYMGRSLDAPVTPDGILRFENTLRAFGRRVQVPKESLLLRSPSLRCEQTLQVMVRVLGLTTPEIVVSEFAETDYGDFEGMTAEEIKMRHPNVVETWLHKPSRMRFPGGESYEEVQRRAMLKVEELEISCPDKMVVVCTHVDVIKMILCALLQIPIDAKVFFDISNGSLTHLRSTYRGLTLRTMNFV